MEGYSMPSQFVTFRIEESLYKQARTIGLQMDKPVQEILKEAVRLWVEEWKEENAANGEC
jgi:hypothetical protein